MQDRDATHLTELLEGTAEQLPLRRLGHPRSVDFRLGYIEDEDRQHLGDHAAEGDRSQVVSEDVRALGMEKGPDEFVENAFVGGRGKQRLRLGADFPPTANQSCYIGVDTGSAEEVQNRFRRGLGRDPGDGASCRGNKCEGIEEDLEVLAVIHGLMRCLTSAGFGLALGGSQLSHSEPDSSQSLPYSFVATVTPDCLAAVIFSPCIISNTKNTTLTVVPLLEYRA